MGAKSRADVTPEIRGALKRALKIMEESGKPLSTIWTRLFDDDPATAMRLAISTLPKEMDITATTLSPEQWLEVMADGSKSEGADPEETLSGQLH